MVKKQEKTFLARARSWATKRGLFGPQAFLRYVMFTFLDCLFEETDEFIFKGGNLLWLYVKTPRHTIDLDLVTRSSKRTEKIKELLKNACVRSKEKGITFHLISFEEIEKQGSMGSAATIEYKTKEGASNTFDLDIVYSLPTKSKLLVSPIDETHKIRGSSIEEIIADKVTACHRFRGGNTRMKDYDDLWRISKSDLAIKWTTVKRLLKAREVPSLIDMIWINSETSASWSRHRRRYKDLPIDLKNVFSGINTWLRKNLSRF